VGAASRARSTLRVPRAQRRSSRGWFLIATIDKEVRMLVANRRTPLWRITTTFSLFAALGIALASVTGCTSGKKSQSKSSEITSEKKAAAPPAATSSRHASYGVSWMNGSTAAEGTYRVAYVMQGTAPLVIDDETTGFQPASGTAGAVDAARAEKIRSYLMMSPIRAIIGNPSDMVMGLTYDGIMKEGGKPLFTYAYDRDEEIAGLKGQHVTVKTAKSGATELELVLSKDYPFPLYVKEHTGTEPLQIFLKDRQ
jgi:hypothetical protein